MASRIRLADPSELCCSYNAVVGTPEEVTKAIEEIRKVLGVDTILWQIDFGAMPFEKARRTLDLFVSYVLPNVGE